MSLGYFRLKLRHCQNLSTTQAVLEPLLWARGHKENRACSELVICYLEGWAEANPAKIVRSVADNYRFQDPLVGVFTKWSLAQYFEILQARCAVAGAAMRRDFAFFLRGPVDEPSHQRELQFWREAPRIGLTGLARIKFAEAGVIAESVAYDLNLASDLLRDRPILAPDERQARA
jgi:hypothetical protein